MKILIGKRPYYPELDEQDTSIKLLKNLTIN